MPSQPSDMEAPQMISEPQLPKVTYNFEEQLKLLHEAKFADFDISCGDHVFKVHRFVLCSQSPFFQALAGGTFKEATDQATTLPDEDAALLVRYLIYLYSSSYPEANVSALQVSSQFEKVIDDYAAQDDYFQSCMLHARMYCFARRRCDERLEKFCLQEFARNFWSKRPRRAVDKHNLVPRGPTRTLKYHMGKYIRDGEQTLIVGTKNTHAEVFDLLADFATWSDISVSQKRVRGADGFPPTYRAARNRDDVWQDSMLSLADFDFDHQHLIVGRTSSSNAKNLSLLSSVDRWQTKIMQKDEQDMIRYILNETTEYGSALKDMLALDLVMRKHNSCLIPDPAYRTLQLEYAEFFLSIDSLVKPQESRQCQKCLSIQPALRQACSCGKWSDACEKNCLSKQLDDLQCFCCMEIGTMKPLEDRSVSSITTDDWAFPPPVPVYIDDGLSDY